MQATTSRSKGGLEVNTKTPSNHKPHKRSHQGTERKRRGRGGDKKESKGKTRTKRNQENRQTENKTKKQKKKGNRGGRKRERVSRANPNTPPFVWFVPTLFVTRWIGVALDGVPQRQCVRFIFAPVPSLRSQGGPPCRRLEPA